jgi:hypothetical protein
MLAMLALLATTFAMLQATERQVSRNYLDTVRAKLLAQSGVEDATSRLQALFPFRAFDAPASWRYWGDDLTETVGPGTVPLEQARNPSFAYETDPGVQNPLDTNVAPLTLSIEGQPRGFSGAMDSGTYGRYGDHYALRVSDLSGRIFVNDGLDGDGSTGLGPVSENLKRILNVLHDVLALPPIAGQKLGEAILANRPSGGYRDSQDLLRAVANDVLLYNRFRNFVTTHAWVDRNVANPVPLSQALVDYEKTQGNWMPYHYARNRGGLYRLGKSKDATGLVTSSGLNTCPPVVPTQAPSGMASACLYGLDTLNPQWIEIAARAPVNVNTAPREVLIALLTGLKGFFVADRRRNNPRWKGAGHGAYAVKSTFSPAGTEGDEYGYLAQTLPIDGPLAGKIAEHLMACRQARSTLGVAPPFDYSNASVWFRGSFRTWRQFNAFADNLATIGLLQDSRPLWHDFTESNSSIDSTGYGPLVASTIQRRRAERAIADVLKANFNPNLHLNELNPDENLWTIVDKTDLVVNSTEFTFLPTGCFEVESLGRVVQPDDGDNCLAVDNRLVAKAKVTAVLKLYDLYRETTQRQFYAGFWAPGQQPSPTPQTNNNFFLEIGPEPDNGLFLGNLGDTSGPPDNEWDGYVALSTHGGPYHGGGLNKPPNTLWRTLQNVPAANELDAALHVHFAHDFDAHHHVLGTVSGADARSEIASRSLPDEAVVNYPDALPDGTNSSYSGPYSPATGPGNVHRLARSFRVIPGITTSLGGFAPSDLRLDGGYSERHAAPAYYACTKSGNIWNFSTDNAQGTASLWIKPSFAPELTGKIRSWWDLSWLHNPCHQGVYHAPFIWWFFPVQYDAALSESGQPNYDYKTPPGITSKWHPMSVACGYASVPEDVVPGSYQTWFWKASRSLNHVGHPDEAFKTSPLRAHRWMHLSYAWLMDPERVFEKGEYYQEFDGHSTSMYVNGAPVVSWAPTFTYQGTYFPEAGGDRMFGQEQHTGGDYNHLRLGAPSKVSNAGFHNPPYRGSFVADATLDELYVWKTRSDKHAQTLWLQGRYAKPLNSGEGTFTSQAIPLNSSPRRGLPKASSVPAPPAPPVPLTSVPLSSSSSIHVLGASWTWYGEALGATGKPVLWDYNSGGGGPSAEIETRLSLGLRDGLLSYGPFDKDDFSEIRAVIQNPSQVRYFFDFRLLTADLATILLATPVLDDVTIYWNDGRIDVMSYMVHGGAF